MSKKKNEEKNEDVMLPVRSKGTLIPGRIPRMECDLIRELRKEGFNPTDVIAEITPAPGILLLERPPLPKEMFTAGRIIIPEKYLKQMSFDVEPNVGKVIKAGFKCRYKAGDYVVFDVTHTAEKDRLPQMVQVRFSKTASRICTMRDEDVLAMLPEAGVMIEWAYGS